MGSSATGCRRGCKYKVTSTRKKRTSVYTGWVQVLHLGNRHCWYHLIFPGSENNTAQYSIPLSATLHNALHHSSHHLVQTQHVSLLERTFQRADRKPAADILRGQKTHPKYTSPSPTQSMMHTPCEHMHPKLRCVNRVKRLRSEFTVE